MKHIDIIDFFLNNSYKNFQVASIFYYLCVVTLQYVAPILMCLYFALMYKTLGGYNWSDLFNNVTNNATSTIPLKSPLTETLFMDDDFDFNDEQESIEKTILDSAKDLQTSFHGLKAVSFFYFSLLVFHSFKSASVINF